MSPKQAAWRRVMAETFKRWFTHDSMAQSAALSYYTAFSLAPVLLVVVTIAGAVFGKDAVRGRLVHQFDGLMGRDQAALVQTVLKGAERDDSGPVAAIAGVVLLIIGATAVFAQLQSALETSGGGIEVSLDPAVGLRIDASGSSVRADLPLTVKGMNSRRRLQGTLGSGGELLRMHTSGGGVRIHGR